MNNNLLEELEPVLLAAGYRIVEVDAAFLHGGVKATLVVDADPTGETGRSGIGLDQCAEVSRLALPRLELFFEQRDVSLEVSSPGIGRKLKNRREYSVFKGRGVSVHIAGEKPVLGKLTDILENEIIVNVDSEEEPRYERIEFARIEKTVLDF